MDERGRGRALAALREEHHLEARVARQEGRRCERGEQHARTFIRSLTAAQCQHLLHALVDSPCAALDLPLTRHRSFEARKLLEALADFRSLRERRRRARPRCGHAAARAQQRALLLSRPHRHEGHLL